MRRVVPVIALCLMMVNAGCNRHYMLPGHNEGNIEAPPDITMHVGERKKLFWTGMTLMAPMRSSGSINAEIPGVVELEFPSSRTAYIRAVSVGSTRLHYYERNNQGFLVTVLPKVN